MSKIYSFRNNWDNFHKTRLVQLFVESSIKNHGKKGTKGIQILQEIKKSEFK